MIKFHGKCILVILYVSNKHKMREMTYRLVTMDTITY
jgi:hypothetical protein